MQYFASHLRPGQQTTHSLRASQYKPSRKRKRDEDVEEPPISPEDDAKSAPPPPNTQSYASFDSLETAQLRVAGLLPDSVLDVPPSPFPHAPARTSKDNFNYTKLQSELASLDPPLYAVNATSRSHPIDRKSEKPALRQTHLSVLTTIMHHCLLEGDYHRAGRAWGMILRTQVAGQPIDPRNHGRWGIGAELLLRRKAQSQFNRSQNGQDSIPIPDNWQSPSDEKYFYSEAGFELAREYYERLIVQHPNRKYVPHAVDDRTFYPAMFSLWIYEVCEKNKRAQQQHEEDIHNSTSGSTSFGEDPTVASDDAHSRASAIKEEELHRAREIAERLDQLVISPPFDKHADLLQLRGMVGLWVSDLILAQEFSEQTEDEWSLGVDELYENITRESTLEKLKRYSESLRELEASQEFFDRAQTNGRRLGGTSTNVDMKIRDLTKKIARLRG